jgi:hypothetical protein
MRTVAMRCDHCDAEVRADFAETLFDRLPADELEFLERYLLAGFSIKALVESSGMGYTAIRSRLDRIIERYRRMNDAEAEKKAVLARIAGGEINAAEAAELIARIGGVDEGGV